MKYFETIFKLVFLALSIVVFVTDNVFSPWFNYFLLSCMFLGIFLIFNKSPSYGHKHTKKEYKMRHLEGILLILFASLISFYVY